MNKNKSEQIQKAIEQITGEKVDHYFLVACNNQGMELESANGRTSAIAVCIANTFINRPELEQMVNDAKKMQSGELGDRVNKLVSKLVEHLGGADHE